MASETSQPSRDETQSTADPSSKSNPAERSSDRLSRFKALQQRQQDSRTLNRKATKAEEQRRNVDPSALTALHRKHAIASHKLLKADAEAAGQDFERKRAWDWTVAESEAWDERMAGKARNRDDVAFQDYTQQARKVYDRQLRALDEPDVAQYEADKAAAVRRAAEAGQLELVETEDGEIVAVDRDGSFAQGEAGAAGRGGGASAGAYKPSKEKVDRMVDDLRQAEQNRNKKRKQRKGETDGGDVTYINEKNRVFNEKLARFYNKYTADMRENFERGTAV